MPGGPSGSGRGGGGAGKHDALAATRGVANVSHRRTWDESAYADAAAERAARDEVAAGENKADARKRRRAGKRKREFFFFFFFLLFLSSPTSISITSRLPSPIYTKRHPHPPLTERDPLQQGLIVERAALRSRDFDLDLASKAGSRLVVGGAAAPKSRQGGFYCAVCDCTLADSGSYLTHLNGRWHNRALGMSMTVDRSTAAEVRDRLAAAGAKRKKARGAGGGGDGGEARGNELDRQLLLTAGPAAAEEESEGEGAGVAVGFGAKVGEGPAPRPPVRPGAGDAPPGAAAAKPPPGLPLAAAEEGVDPMMAAMGFAGFGTSAGR